MRQLLLIVAKHALTLGVVLLASVLTGCGGGKDNLSATPSLAESLVQPGELLSPSTFSLEEALAGVQAVEAPAGVDSGLWDELTAKLTLVLQETAAAKGTSKVASAPPSGERNRVTDLTLLDDGAGGYSLEWSYVNTGDYDLNSEVNIADLTPIGQYFGATSADVDWDVAQLADGDGNGEVNVADVTPIGQNFLAQVAGYKVNGSYLDDGFWTYLGRVDFAAGSNGPPIEFSYAVGSGNYAAYQIAPVDAIGLDGISSSLESSAPVFTQLFMATPATATVGMPADVIFTIGLDDSVVVPIAAELIETNDEGEVLGVVGELLDNGNAANGDQTAGDRIFSYLIPLNPADETRYQYQARITYNAAEGERTAYSNVAEVIFYAEMTGARAQEILDLVESVAAQLDTLAGTMALEDAAAQLAGELANDPQIEAAGMAGSKRGVWWVTYDGIPCAATVFAEGARGGGGPAVEQAQPPQPLSGTAPGYPRQEPSRTASNNHVKVQTDRDVVCYAAYRDQFDTTFGPDDDGPQILDLFTEASCPDFDGYLLENEDCDVAAFKNMGNYGTLIISSHGDTYFKGPNDGWRPLWGIWSAIFDEQVAILTREACTQDNVMANLADLRKGRLMLCDDFGPDSVFAWTPAFVTEYCKRMPNTIVYASACRSRFNNSMAQAFLDAGASVYYGYSEYVSVSFTEEQGVELFERILGGESTTSAFKAGRFDSNKIEGFNFYAAFKRLSRLDISLTLSEYTITNLGLLDDLGDLLAGVMSSKAADINENGVVVGTSNYDGSFNDVTGQFSNQRIHAFIWKDATTGMQDIGTPLEHTSYAYSINDSNQAVGVVRPHPPLTLPGLSSACIWENGEMVLVDEEIYNLDPRPKGFQRSNANRTSGINNGGIIAGQAYFQASGDPGDTDVTGDYGFSYNRGAGSAVNLKTPFEPDEFEGIYSKAEAINNAGVIVGYTGYTLDFPTKRALAFIWKGASMELLSTPADTSSRADSINDRSRVVGTIWGEATGGEAMPAYWGSSGELLIMELLEGDENGAAKDINKYGDVVGYSNDSGILGDGVRAVIWRGYIVPVDLPADLNCLIPPGSGWELIQASAINDKGQIVGYGQINDRIRAFLLTPRSPR
ncbi:DUF3466 family protein [bacterium]|nr:DUF3466 family protein [bacterium]